MSFIVDLSILENHEETEKRLTYLSETLANSIQEVERTQIELKEYALSNSTAAEEIFIQESLKNDNLRNEEERSKRNFRCNKNSKKTINIGNLNKDLYEELRIKYPLVDKATFRRILGMSETISAWTWPELNTLDAVSITLKDRIKMLDVEIDTMRIMPKFMHQVQKI